MKQILFINTLLISILLLISDTIFGENTKTTLDLLCAGKWQAIIEKNESIAEIILTFNKKQEIHDIIPYLKSGKQEKYIVTYDYYLSEIPDSSSFDKKKVGKIKEGKYIIEAASNKINIYEILELTPTYLKIKRLDGAITEWKRKKDDKKNDYNTSKKS